MKSLSVECKINELRHLCIERIYSKNSGKDKLIGYNEMIIKSRSSRRYNVKMKKYSRNDEECCSILNTRVEWSQKDPGGYNLNNNRIIQRYHCLIRIEERRICRNNPIIKEIIKWNRIRNRTWSIWWCFESLSLGSLNSFICRDLINNWGQVIPLKVSICKRYRPVAFVSIGIVLLSKMTLVFLRRSHMVHLAVYCQITIIVLYL